MRHIWWTLFEDPCFLTVVLTYNCYEIEIEMLALVFHILEGFLCVIDDSVSVGSSMEVTDRIASLEQRVQMQEDEIQLLKSALADVVRRLNISEEQQTMLSRKGPTKGTTQTLCHLICWKVLEFPDRVIYFSFAFNLSCFARTCSAFPHWRTILYRTTCVPFLSFHLHPTLLRLQYSLLLLFISFLLSLPFPFPERFSHMWACLEAAVRRDSPSSDSSVGKPGRQWGSCLTCQELLTNTKSTV